MEHKDYLVDVLNEASEIVGSKPRRDINKTIDIYHSVFVVLITPRGEIVLSLVPARRDLPNLYAHSTGATIATIRRTSETAEQAAQRGLERELFIHNASIKLLGEGMVTFSGKPTYLSIYYAVHEVPADYNATDIAALRIVPLAELSALLKDKNERFTPTLHYIWKTHGHTLLDYPYDGLRLRGT